MSNRKSNGGGQIMTNLSLGMTEGNCLKQVWVNPASGNKYDVVLGHNGNPFQIGGYQVGNLKKGSLRVLKNGHLGYRPIKRVLI